MPALESLHNAELRLARYYAQKLHYISTMYTSGGASVSAALNTYDQESAQIKQWQKRVVAQAGDDSDCDQLTVEFAANMVVEREVLSEKIAWLEQGLAAARHLMDYAAQASFLSELSYIALSKGEIPAARTLAEQALSIAQAAKNAALEARALIRMGQVVSEGGDLDMAKQCMQRALALDELDNKSKMTVYNELGIIAATEGDNETAITYFDDIIRLCEARGDLYGLAMALHNRAILYRMAGNEREGIHLVHESLAIKRNLGAKNDLMLGLQLLTEHYLTLGAIAEAQTYVNEHLALAQELDSPVQIVRAYHSQFEIDVLRGHYEQASANLMIKADLISELGALHAVVGHTLGRVQLGIITGAYTEAREMCLQTLNATNLPLEPRYKYLLNQYLGQIALATAELEGVVTRFREAMTFAPGRGVAEMELHSALADVYLRQGDFAQAQAEITTARQIAAENPDEPGVFMHITADIVQINLHLRSGQIQEARAALRDVLNQARNLEVIKPRLEALQATAEFFVVLGDPRCLRLFSFVAHHLGATDMQRTSTRMRQSQLSDQFDSAGGSADESKSSYLELNTVLGELAKEF